MPFFDDSGPRPEQETNLLWRAIALLSDQLERMIALNLAWALQVVPLFVAILLPLPAWARLLLSLYSVVAFIPATGTLYDVLYQTSRGLPLSVRLVRESLQARFKESFLKLLPLYSLFYWLALLAWFAARQNWLFVDVLARLLILGLAVVSLYWGGSFAGAPDNSPLKILNHSLQMFWKKPGASLLCGVYCLIALLIGAISVGGIFLIVPVLIALLQIQLYQGVAE